LLISGGEPIKAVVAHRGLDRSILLAPVRDEPIKPDRVDHGAREDVGTDLRALFDHDHRGLGRQLLEPDRGREPGRPGADDHHVELHGLAGGQFVGAHPLLQKAGTILKPTVATNRERSTSSSILHRYPRVA
jgi:hypothetical protein